LRPYELFIGLRYTRAKRRNHFISFISLISIIGVGLGVTALIVVLSVMNGFQKEVRERTLGISPHLQVTNSAQHIEGWQPLLQSVSRYPHVIGAAPFVNGQGMLSLGDRSQGMMVRGILPEAENQLTGIGKKMKEGQLSSLRPDEFHIVLGIDLARMLDARIGDKILLITPQGQISPAGLMPRAKQFRVTGIFQVGMFPFDNALAMIHLSDAQKLFRTGNAVSGIGARLDDLEQAPQLTSLLMKKLPDDLYATDWTRDNPNYFRAVQLEKKMMFIILSLIVAVAAFNIVSTLVMMVTDKQADIAILRTLGASPVSIMKIFLVQGVVIGLLGTTLGVVGGILISLNLEAIVSFIESTFHIQFIDPTVYLINDLPSDLHEGDVFTVAYISFMLSVVATLYPSWRASRTQPAEALKYE